MPEITRIQDSDPASRFKCGVHALDDYFRRHALANDREGISAAYVLRPVAADAPALPAVLGYYTLSMALIQPEQASRVSRPARGFPRFPLPAALIGRLAVHQLAKGNRFGERLLMDALRRALLASDTVGCTGVIVDAKDEPACRFYLLYGFVPVQEEGWPRRLYLPMETCRVAFSSKK